MKLPRACVYSFIIELALRHRDQIVRFEMPNLYHRIATSKSTLIDSVLHRNMF